MGVHRRGAPSLPAPVRAGSRNEEQEETTVGKNADWAKRWVEISAQAVSENREYLIDLDRQIGDGDHGENMDRGFSAVISGEGLEQAQSGSDVLKYVAKTLLSQVGGAAGPLYGTAYLRAAGAVPEANLVPSDVAPILQAAVGGVQARGKAVAGEKTMVDAWLPAVAEASAACAAGGGVAEVFAAAASAARSGAESTVPMKATKGRASYLGERSVGHLDPGAESSALILQAAAQAASEVFGQEAK